MKKRFIIITSFLPLTVISFGQKILLDKFITPDTLKIGVERMGDRVGPYDQDTLLLVKTKTDLILHSDKRGKWYKIDKATFKTLRDMEKKGMKGNATGGRGVDYFYFKLHNKTSNFSLPANYFTDFMLLLKTNYLDNQTRPLD